MEETKECSQCHKKCVRDQFSKKQWKKHKNPSCRLCAGYTKISNEKSRTCHHCKLELPRTEFAIYQWGRGDKALCHSCRDKFDQKVLSSINLNEDSHGDLNIDAVNKETKELPDGTIVCGPHSKESCDICMMDFRLPNDFQRKKNELGRDLTPEEYEEVTKESMKDVYISKKICIMDGQPVCPRTSKKMRCPCDEVTYCSTACQKFHWTIHKMTCKYHAKRKEEKLKKKMEEEREKQVKAAQMNSAGRELTEEQKNIARKEAFFSENNGRLHSIEECAWQLGEHPLVIGGGTLTYGRDGTEEFTKGDVAKIYREKAGVEWDGSPRFGLKPYKQKKDPVDWIAIARQGISPRMKDMEEKLKLMAGYDTNL